MQAVHTQQPDNARRFQIQKRSVQPLPPETPSPDEASAMLSAEMEQMSLDEREEIQRGLNGDAIVDDAKMISSLSKKSQESAASCMSVARCLDELDVELDNIFPKVAYDMAERKSPYYVRRATFRLKFLRADQFNIERAAKRIVRHFDLKLDLFGEELLAKDIGHDDLDVDDLVILESGGLIELPHRDQFGRTVVYQRPAVTNYYNLRNVFRNYWYFAMKIFDDEHNQINGIVFICQNDGLDIEAAHESVKMEGRTREALPIVLAAAHYCVDEPKLIAEVALIKHMLDKPARLRLMHHCGTKLENQSILRSFGVPGLFVPTFSLAEVMLVKRTEHLQARQQSTLLIEDGNSIVPGRFDVCFGRGRSRDHTGNRRLCHIVEMHRAQYAQANRFQKTEIAERIVRIVHESGGRFLKLDDEGGGWTTVNLVTSRNKVSKLFQRKK